MAAAVLLSMFFSITACAVAQKDIQETSSIEAYEDRRLMPLSMYRPPGSYYYYLVAQDLLRSNKIPEASVFLEKSVSLDPGSILLKQELALVYLQIGEKEQALALCEEILEIQPDHTETLIIAASLKQSKGDIEAAADLYEKVLIKEPDRINIHLVLGRLYLEEDRYEDAQSVFRRLVDRHPDTYQGYYYLGVAYAGAGKTDKAIEALTRSLNIEPALSEARYALIRIYEEKGDKQEVIDGYEDIVGHHPEDASAAITLGLLYLEGGFDEKAAVLFENLGRMAGTDRSVVDAVVQTLISRNRYEEAVSVIEGMLEGLPDDADLRYLAGISAYLLDRHDDAKFHLKQVDVESRFYVDSVVHRTDIYNQQERHEKGIEALSRALGNTDALTGAEKLRLKRFLGALYIETGKYRRAIDVFKQGLSIEPENTDLLYDLGVAYDKNGENDKTIEQMKKIIDIDPKHAHALNYLGYTYAEAGIRLDDAKALIRRALDLKPDNGHILDSMGWVYFKQGDIERAVLYLERAVEKRPEDPVILDHLGDAYLEQNRLEDALSLYERALFAANGDDDIRRKIEQKIEKLKKKQ